MQKLCVVQLFVIVLGCAVLVNADDEQATSTKNEVRAAEALILTQDTAAALKILGGEHGTDPLKLVASPLQRYNNPIVGEFYAHLFIWTNKGRPEAAAAVAKWYAPANSLRIEFHSLGLQAISAEYKQTEIWHPKEAGVAFSVIPQSRTPASNAATRLLEMRKLARQFRAHVTAVNRGNVDEDLRLLVKPVFRYSSQDPDILDGAIFSFVRGTDPELLLLIEARKTAGKFSWMYSLAPLNSFEFRAFHRDRVVWTKLQIAPPWTNTRDPTKPYMVYMVPQKS